MVAAYEAGKGTYAEISTRFAVGEASVNRWDNVKRTEHWFRSQRQAELDRRSRCPTSKRRWQRAQMRPRSN
ncbi:MAG: hypothetical protein KF773_24210 [Deltaproteobacteria bacterium]|nr:hypothetical protein [Deltaproteobacteria bacterium]